MRIDKLRFFGLVNIMVVPNSAQEYKTYSKICSIRINHKVKNKSRDYNRLSCLGLDKSLFCVNSTHHRKQKKMVPERTVLDTSRYQSLEWLIPIMI